MSSNKPDRPHSLLIDLDALAHLEPAPAAAAIALARTRAALLHAQTSRKRKRVLMRIAIPSSIAAVLFSAALLIFSLQLPRQASAAEQLDAAVQTTKAYKGWIKVSAQFPKGMSSPASTQPLFTDADSYYNTDGSFTSVRAPNLADPADHNLELAFWSVPRNEIATYSPTTNEIRLGTMMDIQKQQITEHPAPTTIAEIIDEQKRDFGIRPLAIKESADGDLTRFDITLFASSEAAQKCAKEYHMAFLGTSISVWVNHDHLMARMRFDDTQGPITLNYIYNVPGIHNLYDLGVPRSAKIIDNRLTKNLQALMDRLDARAQKNFGNYTAFITSYELDEHGVPSTIFGYLYLFAKHDNHWCALEYRLFKPNPKRPWITGYVLQSAPSKWPSPDFKTLLPILQESLPTQYWVFDGHRGAAGWYNAKTKSYPNARVVEPEEHASVTAGLAGKIWPSRLANWIGSPQVHANLLQDKDHPGLIGLHYVRIEKPSDNTDGGTTWWLDPARDDMPVEISYSSLDKNGKPTIVSSTHYLEYAQLPTGEWYPIHWREDRIDIDTHTGKKNESTSNYRLQILPALTLDSSWFQPPHPKSFDPQSAP